MTSPQVCNIAVISGQFDKNCGFFVIGPFFCQGHFFRYSLYYNNCAFQASKIKTIPMFLMTFSSSDYQVFTHPDIHFWKKVVGAGIFHETSKTFVQPEMRPPLHCHEISKPLMGHFMCYYYGNL